VAVGVAALAVLATTSEMAVAVSPPGSPTPSATGYVVSYGDMSVINPATNTVSDASISGSSIGSGFTPGPPAEHVAITPSGAFVYQINTSGLYVISTSSNQVVDTIKLAEDPTAIAMAPNGTTLWALAPNEVFSISTQSNSVTAQIAIAGSSNANNSIAVSADSSSVYFTASFNTGSWGLGVISAATDTVTSTVGLNSIDSTTYCTSTPMPFVVSGSTAYVACEGASSKGWVIGVNLSTDAVIGTPAQVGTDPLDPVLDGSTLYVANYGSGSVSAVNVTTLSGTPAVTTIAIASSDPDALGVDGSTLYVVNYNSVGTVSLISTSSNTLDATTITVGSDPVEITAEGADLYVVNYGADTVSVIDSSTQAVTATMTVGTDPQDVVFAVAGESTTTALVPTPSSTVTVGTAVTYTATVSSTPDGGTVSFTDATGVLAGCGAVAVNTSTGVATCAETYQSAGKDTVTATYSGDYPADPTLYDGSASAAVTETINAPTQTPPENAGYVASYGGTSVINPATNTVSDASIGGSSTGVGLSPGPAVTEREAITPSGSFIYQVQSSGLYVISTSSNKVVDTIKLAEDPTSIAMAPNGTTLWALAPNEVFSISTQSNSVTAQIAIAGSTNADNSIAVSADSSSVYFTASFSTGSWGLGVISAATDTVTSTVSLNSIDATTYCTSTPMPFVVSGSTAYVACAGASSTGWVIGVNLSTDAVIGTPAQVGTDPLDPVLDGSTLYVANYGSGSVSAVNVTTLSGTPAVTTITIPTSAPDALGVDGSTLYVANYSLGTVSLINTSTNTLAPTAPIGVGTNPIQIVVEGASVYVVNYGPDTISVIDNSTQAETATMTVGTDPEDLLFAAEGYATTTALVPTPSSTVTVGTAVTYTATVSSSAPTSAPNGGTVSFTDATGVLAGCGAVAVNTSTGVATCAETYQSAGKDTVTATYSGDYPADPTLYDGSASAAVTETINAPTQTPPENAGYVASYGGTSVINPATNTVSDASIGGSSTGVGFTLGNSSETEAVTPNGAFVYESESSTPGLYVISTSSNKVVDTIKLPRQPLSIAMAPNGEALWVLMPDFVARIDTASNTSIAHPLIEGTASASDAIEVSADSSTVYFTEDLTTGGEGLGVISAATDTETATVSLETTCDAVPMPFVVSGSTAYVACEGASSTGWVVGIDLSTDAVIGAAQVGTDPLDPVLDGSTLYVANYGSGSVSAVKTSSLASTPSVTTITIPTSAPDALGLDGTTLYVANYSLGTVSLINTSTNTLAPTAPIGVGTNPIQIVVEGGSVYVVNYGPDTISVIDNSTQAETATMTVGTDPQGLVFAAEGNATTTALAVAPGTTEPTDTPVTFKATVSPVPDGGTVTFGDATGVFGSCPAEAVNTSTGIATCVVTFQNTGTLAVTATYNGDYPTPNHYDGSISAPLTETITQGVKTGTHTKITTSKNPGTVGTQLTYTATVTPAPNGGTVAFTDSVSGTLSGCGTVAVNASTGVATCKITYEATGSHSITAAYSGDSTYGASSTGTLVETINPASLPRHQHRSGHRSHRSAPRR
jgi:YVTN family beta-propeller protein